jgi:hypothetical protein
MRATCWPRQQARFRPIYRPESYDGRENSTLETQTRFINRHAADSHTFAGIRPWGLPAHPAKAPGKGHAHEIAPTETRRSVGTPRLARSQLVNGRKNRLAVQRWQLPVAILPFHPALTAHYYALQNDLSLSGRRTDRQRQAGKITQFCQQPDR